MSVALVAILGHQFIPHIHVLDQKSAHHICHHMTQAEPSQSCCHAEIAPVTQECSCDADCPNCLAPVEQEKECNLLAIFSQTEVQQLCIFPIEKKSIQYFETTDTDFPDECKVLVISEYCGEISLRAPPVKTLV